jgi:hypothetical protein
VTCREGGGERKWGTIYSEIFRRQRAYIEMYISTSRNSTNYSALEFPIKPNIFDHGAYQIQVEGYPFSRFPLFIQCSGGHDTPRMLKFQLPESDSRSPGHAYMQRRNQFPHSNNDKKKQEKAGLVIGHYALQSIVLASTQRRMTEGGSPMLSPKGDTELCPRIVKLPSHPRQLKIHGYDSARDISKSPLG